jgi:hypothetical protein
MMGRATAKRGTSVLLVVALMLVMSLGTTTPALAAPSLENCLEKVIKQANDHPGKVPPSCGVKQP